MSILNIFKKPEEQPKEDVKPIYKIVVAEDDLDLRDFYKELLTREGYEVVTATNGQEALDLIHQTNPHVIILDIMMPVMDGNEVLQKLKNTDTTKDIPVIMLTNAGSINNMDNAKMYSAFRFFIKCNVAPEEILKTVDEAVRSYQRTIQQATGSPQQTS